METLTITSPRGFRREARVKRAKRLAKIGFHATTGTVKGILWAAGIVGVYLFIAG